ncbi:hypothetical protein HZR84_03765 [Hyphobacterium sp. CCMP332]|nr:hypothetical protein HZR84_03765 [Hyphobacterium sp. CCMP332]
MSFEYNSTFFLEDGRLRTKGKKLQSFRVFRMKNGVLIGMFQGNRGDRPDLDFIIKYLEPGTKSQLRTPSHTHWTVSLLINSVNQQKRVSEIIQFYNNWYEKANPVKNLEERNNYELITVEKMMENFPKEKEVKGIYSIEFICSIIELFTVCEKQTPRGYKMFPNLLRMLRRYTDDEADFYQVVSAAKAGF